MNENIEKYREEQRFLGILRPSYILEVPDLYLILLIKSESPVNQQICQDQQNQSDRHFCEKCLAIRAISKPIRSIFPLSTDFELRLVIFEISKFFVSDRGKIKNNPK